MLVWLISNILIIHNIFGLYTQEEWINSTFLYYRNRITADPENSEYPEELLPTSWIGSWQTPYQDKFDLKKKFANQTTLLAAPDYVEPEYEIQTIESPEEEGE